MKSKRLEWLDVFLAAHPDLDFCTKEGRVQLKAIAEVEERQRKGAVSVNRMKLPTVARPATPGFEDAALFPAETTDAAAQDDCNPNEATPEIVRDGDDLESLFGGSEDVCPDLDLSVLEMVETESVPQENTVVDPSGNTSVLPGSPGTVDAPAAVQLSPVAVPSAPVEFAPVTGDNSLPVIEVLNNTTPNALPTIPEEPTSPAAAPAAVPESLVEKGVQQPVIPDVVPAKIDQLDLTEKGSAS